MLTKWYICICLVNVKNSKNCILHLKMCLNYIICIFTFILFLGGFFMKKRIITIAKGSLKQSASHGGCGECQTSCQSACKTSCTVANQECEREKIIFLKINIILSIVC